MHHIEGGKRWLLQVGLIAGALAASGCRPRPLPPPDGLEPGRVKLLEALSGCQADLTAEMNVKTAHLWAAVDAWKATPSSGTLVDARAAFVAVIGAWQILEGMSFGPAATTAAPGGQDLRDNIYSFPLVSPCAVDEQLVSQGYAAATFPSTLVNRRGLAALETLLFREGATSACAAGSATADQYAALSEGEREGRRRAYAKVVASDIGQRVSQLAAAWSDVEGSFARSFESAGRGSSHFASSQAALNAVTDAAFYLEAVVKDQKLARPLALRDCAQTICPELLESQEAELAKAHLDRNLHGFRKILQGCGADGSGQGLDDLLAAANASAVAGKLVTGVAHAQAAIDALGHATLREALVNETPKVRLIYDRLKAVTDVMKTELVTALDLELPQLLEGDND